MISITHLTTQWLIKRAPPKLSESKLGRYLRHWWSTLVGRKTLHPCQSLYYCLCFQRQDITLKKFVDAWRLCWANIFKLNKKDTLIHNTVHIYILYIRIYIYIREMLCLNMFCCLTEHFLRPGSYSLIKFAFPLRPRKSFEAAELWVVMLRELCGAQSLLAT